MPSREQIERFRSDGYLVLPGFKTARELDAVRARAEAIVDAFVDAIEPGARRQVFSTGHERPDDDYFLASADQVCCFFEAEAFDAAGELRQAKALSINKIGHALHDRDAVFDAFSRGPALAAVARDLGIAEPLVWQSMYIFKQPGIGGEVGWHQDATFFLTEPLSVTTFWFALEDANEDNGCLWVQPGGHRGPLRELFVREGDATRMRKLDATPWPTQAEAVPLPVAAGTLVCFHGLLPHYSAPNRSPRSRHAYSLHVTDARTRYAESNWLQRRGDPPLRGF